jgi:RHS repeat-associated protein
MISATGPGNQETTYGYDNAGNRTSVRAGNATPVTTTYDASGLAISSNGGTPQDAADDTTYINDASGRLVGIDAPGTADDRCYSYDRFDLLNDFSKGSTSGCDLFPGFHWGYDAFNRPSDKTYNTTTGTVTLDSYSYLGTSSELTQIATTTWYPSQRTATNYAGTPFGPLAQSDASGTRFDITDLHGDLVGTVATSGAIAGSKLYSPWGEPQGSSGQGSTLGFQGQPTDADTGFVKTDTRLYDATQGRFTTQDSLFGDTQSPSSMNQFGYGEGNPVTHGDPSGLLVCGGTGYLTATFTERNANLPLVRACIGRPDRDTVTIAADIKFKKNDATTRWFKVVVNLKEQNTDNSSWVPTTKFASGRWCTPRGAGCPNGMVTTLNAGTPVRVVSQDLIAPWLDCGSAEDGCWLSQITRVEVQDKKGLHSNSWVNSYSDPIP